MNLVYKFTFILFLISSMVCKAQEHTNFLFYEQNMSLLNPAYTGSSGKLVGLSYKSGWSGIANSPRLASFIFHAPSKTAKTSWGLNVQSNKVFIEHRGTVSLDYSYRLFFGNTTYLYFGVKAGAYYNRIDTDGINRITQENNPSLNDINNYMSPLVGAGAYLKNKNFYFGISVPNFIRPKIFSELEETNSIAGQRLYYSLVGGVHIKLSNLVTLRPGILYQMVNDGPNQFTGLGKLDIGNVFTVGLGVSNNNYVASLVQFNMKKLELGIGYVMRQRISGSALQANTTELMMSYHLN